jgi:hypothetical protein
VLVLEGEILANDGELAGQPVLEIGSGFEDVDALCAGAFVWLNVGVLDAS